VTHIGPGGAFRKIFVEKRAEMESSNRRLMWHGMFLFLIGLLTGFAEQHFANIRMERMGTGL